MDGLKNLFVRPATGTATGTATPQLTATAMYFTILGIGGRLRSTYNYMIKYMAAAVAVAVSGGVAVPVAVPVAGLTKRISNQKDFLINVWG